MTPPWIGSLREMLAPEQVSTSEEDLRAHSYDCWPVAAKWRQQGKRPCRPDAVAYPRRTGEVSRLVRWAVQNGVPVTPWGAGSSVTGAPLPLRGGIALDMSRMNRVLGLDEVNLLVSVEAGKMGHELEAELNARGYTLNHSPQSLNRSTVGGWVATRATGQFSSRWGGIEDLLVALAAVLPTGEVVETRAAPRAAIGPDLRHLFMGAEGTLGVITRATLKVFPLGGHRVLEALAFGRVEAGLEAMRRVMREGLRPFLVRFYDEAESRHAMREEDFGGCAMFLGFEGVEAVARAEHRAGREICEAEGGRALGPAPVEAWMERRFDFSAVEDVLNRPGGVAETIEVAHFWDGILGTYRALKEGLAPLASEVLGHFSHVYPQGTSLYVILLGEAEGASEAARRLEEIWKVSMEACLQTGAVISHHHGVGLARLPYLRRDAASGMVVLERIKRALDPTGIFNPGKLTLNGEAEADG